MNFDSIEYVIIKAGGTGSRMQNFTKNKPKCLISYKGKTILENMLDTFSGKKIVILTDYLDSVLQKYVVNVLKRKDIHFINVSSKTTSTGLSKALSLVNDDSSFIYVWSDIIFEKPPVFDITGDVLIGTTNCFECRYCIKNEQVVKEKSDKDGIFGFFAFNKKNLLEKIDESVSFVGNNIKNISKSSKIQFKNFENVLEIGTKEKYLKLLNKTTFCRFFNKIDFVDNFVIKHCIDVNYQSLIQDEIKWYEFLKNKIDFIPEIISTNPLTLSKIEGIQLHKENISDSLKPKILDCIFSNLDKLHSLDKQPAIQSDLNDVYFAKTFNRIDSVSCMIPFINDEYIKINGRMNLNPIHKNNIEKFIEQIKSIKVNEYNIIHGDITFSNIIFENSKAYFIDPRGHFGNTKIYGDKNYDWAKLYYSVNGNYDSINTKEFEVCINGKEVELNIKSNKFEHLSNYVLQASKMNLFSMELMHSLIWLSLTGYVKEDIDSILYSYYKGVELWNLTLK